MGGAYVLPDLGPVRLPCPNVDGTGCVEDDRGMFWQEQLEPLATFNGAIDGIGGSQWLSITTVEGDSQQVQHTHKLNGSLDASVSQSVKIAGGLASLDVEEKITLSSSGSWGEMSTQETTTEATEGVKLELEAIESTMAYDYESVLYVTQDGTWKLAFSADPLGNDTGKYFWASEELYGGGPDPALNLPSRFNAHWDPNTHLLTSYVVNVEEVRNRIRGFFVKQPALDSISGTYPLLGRAIEAGETVRLEVRVYNYTLAQDGTVSNLAVRFTAVPDDDPSAGVVLGTATVPILDPREIETAALVWDTNQAPFIGAAGSTRRWRIWVELDPENAIPDEIYETEDPLNLPFCDEYGHCVDPGQNNEGWAEVDIHTQAAGGAPGMKPVFRLHDDAMGALDKHGRLKTRVAQATAGQPVSIRVMAAADMASSEYRPVRLYDGHPDEGGELIGEMLAFVGNPEGAEVWFHWTPMDVGTHQLYARMLVHESDTADETFATLRVQVHKAKKPHPKGKVKGR